MAPHEQIKYRPKVNGEKERSTKEAGNETERPDRGTAKPKKGKNKRGEKAQKENKNGRV